MRRQVAGSITPGIEVVAFTKMMVVAGGLLKFLPYPPYELAELGLASVCGGETGTDQSLFLQITHHAPQAICIHTDYKDYMTLNARALSYQTTPQGLR